VCTFSVLVYLERLKGRDTDVTKIWLTAVVPDKWVC